ncbi:diguanylate cyclase [Rhodovulum sp. PH10]|uniref:bifunctional diguanylate cyclase/phosphodiesterase n=1 Tax=Rhodovulum sp. PH10 TaxID=1187851 RepID=UPI00027C2456|nr:EAL domain-containing protein [Rhodovulum sp. PH10]EJW13349.1 diguanylate cyclase [Rhodovulum sp. PH10]
MTNERSRPAGLFAGIRIRLLGLILVALTPLIGTLAAALLHERGEAIDSAGRRVETLARRTAGRYREIVVEARTVLEMAALAPEVTGGSPQTCARFLDRAGENRPWADGFWVIDPSGRVVCTTTPGGLDVDLSDRPYVTRAIAEHRFVVSDFLVNRVTGVPVNVAVLPLLGPEDTVTGLVAVTLKMSWFNRLVEDLGADGKVTFWLTDAAGILMARFPERAERIGRFNGDSELLQEMLRRTDGWADTATLDGPRRIYGFVQIPETGARVAVGLDRAEVLAPVETRIVRGMLVIAAALFLAVVTGIAMARRIVWPLEVLTAGAEAARRSRAVSLPRVEGYAEIESLSRSLDALLDERGKREEALSAARAAAEKATAEAHVAHARLLDALETVPVGLAFFDAEDRFVLWNRRYDEIYEGSPEAVFPGYTFEERLRARVKADLIPSARGREEEWIAERLARFHAEASHHEQQLADGRWVRIEERRTADGGSMGIRVDITESKRREESFRLLFDANPVPMWVFDRETLRFLAINDAAVEHYGYDRETFLTMSVLDIRDPVDHQEASKVARSDEPARGDRVWRHRRADGNEVLITAYTRLLDYQGHPAKLAALIDITEKWHDEARIRHLAHYDALTDLANRTLFRARLQRALDRSRDPDEGTALICIDLDGFKDVNDTLGHPIGDQLLKLVARRVSGCVREEDTPARLGGDEFAVIQDGIRSREDASALASRLVAVISAPYMVEGHEITVTPSVGIATTFDGSCDLDDLLNHADMALYRAKSRGRSGHCFFAPEMDAELKARHALETHLRAAFERRDFAVHYQPWVDLADDSVSGFEALLRWHHPEHGPVSPAEFVPLAEKIGLIVPLGEWVLMQACADAVTWPERVKIAINLSPVQFRTGDIVETVRAALATSGLSAARLELEITETVLLEDNASNLATLHALRDLGVKVAMDDFGTGYSSLGYLRRFPFDKIKIDRSFVSELPGSHDCLTITRGITELAAGLRMTTIAEGIETPGQREVLRSLGCDEGQGFLFGRAVPASEVAAILAATESAAA